MSDTANVSGSIGGSEEKTITFEAGLLAQQANGAVLATTGKTQVLVTATAANQAREGADFFPLTVDIEERMYAAGKIPGSFFRREARPSDEAILSCRLIDRPLRPAFPEGFRNEIHVVGTILGADQKNPYDVLTINTASLALCISDIPFSDPIGAVRISYGSEGKWIVNPTYEELESSAFEMVVAGRIAGSDDVAITMVEAGATEQAWDLYDEGLEKVSEQTLADGLEFAKQSIRDSVELQRQLIAAAGAKTIMEFETVSDYSEEAYSFVSENSEDRTKSVIGTADKVERESALNEIKSDLQAKAAEQFGEDSNIPSEISAAFKDFQKSLVRQIIVSDNKRMDGRGSTDIRQLSSNVGVLLSAHGSGLFQRGETQVLNTTTLGTQRMDQMIDGITPLEKKRYMHHYNFPPFSTGETGFMRGPKRREIGHGALAERALAAVVPDFEDFPYTIRLVSEVLSSNGSTSMASVCSSSLSLMDAGVPIRAAVAGIAMGLVYENDQYITLTDIIGAEDAFGDMDFKVAGTSDAVTALQMDTKIDGIPSSVLSEALNQAKDARMKILDVMNEAISEPREEIGENAPKIVSFEIPLDKVGEVIGPKGKVINALQADTGTEISVTDEGEVPLVTIASPDMEAVREARRQVELITDPPQAEIGEVYEGEVVNITKFGAFVNIMPGQDGLLHISKLGGNRRLDRVEDAVNLGDRVSVVVDEVDNSGGRISLSLTEDSDGGGQSPDTDRDHDSGSSDRSGRNNRDSHDRGDRGGRNNRDSHDRGGRGGRDNRDRGDRSRGNDRGGRNDRDSHDRGGRGGRDNRDRGDRSRGNDRGGRNDRNSHDKNEVSFEDTFDQQMDSDH